jgi:lipopolysaccharide transport system permease protein
MITVSRPIDYFKRIWHLRYFWISLVRNDLNARYRRSFLGIGWSLAKPLGMTLVLCIVFGKMFDMPAKEYAPYLFLGLASWQFITECIAQGCQCFLRGGPYIKQAQLPLAGFPLRAVLCSGFHAVTALVLAMIVAFYLNGVHSPLVLLSLIPSLLLVFVLGWFLAIIAGLMHTHFPDTQHMTEIVLQVLFYITPIIYRPSTISSRARLSWVIEWNPLTSVLDLIRNPILDGALPSVASVRMSLAFVLVLGLTAFIMLRRTERTLVFWV